jgi:hypothetical protein
LPLQHARRYGTKSVQGSGRPEHPTRPPIHHAEKCKRCGKQGELVNGLCNECAWEIKTGLKPPVAETVKKKHFWSLKS